MTLTLLITILLLLLYWSFILSDKVVKYCVPVDAILYPPTEFRIEPLLKRLQG